VTGPQRLPPTVSGWELRVGPSYEFTFDKQLGELFAILEPVRDEIRQTCDNLGLQVEISCVAYIDQVCPGLHLTSDQLATIQAMGAEVDIDFMLAGPDE